MASILSPDQGDAEWTSYVLMTVAQVHKSCHRPLRERLAKTAAWNHQPDALLTAMIRVVTHYRAYELGRYFVKVLERGVESMLFAVRPTVKELNRVGIDTQADKAMAEHIKALTFQLASGIRVTKRGDQCKPELIALRRRFESVVRQDLRGAGKLLRGAFGTLVETNLPDVLSELGWQDSYTMGRIVGEAIEASA